MIPRNYLAILARAPDTKDVLSVLAYIGAAMLILAIGGASITFIRRRALRLDDDRTADSGLLDELRAARRRGDISEEEFEAAKRAIALKLRSSLAPDHKGKPGR